MCPREKVIFQDFNLSARTCKYTGTGKKFNCRKSNLIVKNSKNIKGYGIVDAGNFIFIRGLEIAYHIREVQGGSNMTGTNCV